MKKIITINLISAFFVVLLISCNSSNGDGLKVDFFIKNYPGDPVAKVNSAVITKKYLEKNIRSDYYVQFNSNIEKKEDMVNYQIDQEVLFQEALKEGYLSNPAFQKEIKKLLSEKIFYNIFDSTKTDLQVNEKDISEYYANHIMDFTSQGKLKQIYVYLPFDNNKIAALKTATKVRKEALSMLDNPKLKTNFVKLITKYSKPLPSGDVFDPNKVKEYESKEESIHKFGKTVAESLWTMKEEEKISPVIEGEHGYFVFYRRMFKPFKVESLASKSDLIRGKLFNEKHRERIKNYLEKLKKNYKIEIYHDRLKDLKLGSQA